MFWVPLDRLPNTPNGKTDRIALVQRGIPESEPSRSRAAATDDERCLVGLFVDATRAGAESIGVDDDFFAWLEGFRFEGTVHAVPEGTAKARATLTAEVSGQTITIESADVQACTLLLHDDLLDLDQPISVIANGTQVFSGTVRRTERAIRDALAARLDRRMAPSASVTVSW